MEIGIWGDSITYGAGDSEALGWVATTYYPDKYYSLQGATTTLHIFAGDSLIATIEGNGMATSTKYDHGDHLGSTQVTTDSSGILAQTLDYYPYGSKRINQGTGTEQRQYIGQYFDTDTSLSYLNARYYEGSRGQFLSQDPVFLALGSPKLTEILTRIATLPNASFRSETIGGQIQQEGNRRISQEFLSDPQLLNAYGYARNNPLRYSDPTGEAIPLLPILGIYSIAQTLINLYEAKTVFWDYPEVFNKQEKFQTGFKIGLDTALFGAGRATKDVAERTFLQVAPAVLDVMDHYFGSQVYSNSSTNQNQLQNTTRNSVSSNYTGTQSSAISSLAQSFGVSSLSATQTKAIDQVRSAFSKK
ncbi:MAG: RHS repeat-associated core domain-containing protein [bacterium]|nr:RHS repeat-associated core domain-containing protein [bacterium]